MSWKLNPQDLLRYITYFDICDRLKMKFLHRVAGYKNLTIEGSLGAESLRIDFFPTNLGPTRQLLPKT